jgi:hypothetical protein
MNQQLMKAIAVEDKNRLRTRTMQWKLQAIASERGTTNRVD